jgi:hypothetical protein
MILIAHRGNIYGPNSETENCEETIDIAIAHDFECEIDIWKIGDVFYLGHDGPDRKTSLSFLEKRSSSLWIHCKNLSALIDLKDRFNCFFHDNDTYTITSKGYIWGNIGSPMTSQTIQVMPEKSNIFSKECLGICTDFPFEYLKSV